MQLLAGLLVLSSAAVNAHYVYPAFVQGGQRTEDWTYVRATADRFNKAPIQDVLSPSIRCNEDPALSATEVLSVAAGEEVKFACDSGISHPGPLQFYLAKVPEGETAATWDGSGKNWFKIFGEGPTTNGGSYTWPSLGVGEPSVTLPSSLPSGEYLIRVEHIAMHGSYEVGGAQFYIACGQIEVTGGGSGTPTPLVSFPGAYDPNEPGLLFDIYTTGQEYTLPGPAIWTG